MIHSRTADWAAHRGHKAVIVVEGRDAAARAAVTKRITQGLNPRICRRIRAPASARLEVPVWVDSGHWRSQVHFGLQL